MDLSSSTPEGASSLPVSLHHAKVIGLPSTAYYIPNFISQEEEQLILEKVSFIRQDSHLSPLTLSLDCLSTQAQVETTHSSQAPNMAV